jgi:hypothetical protein
MKAPSETTAPHVTTPDVPEGEPREAASASAEEGEGRVLWIHSGHSANCSSVGSVVDYVMVAGTAGAALLAAVTVWLSEKIRDGK